MDGVNSLARSGHAHEAPHGSANLGDLLIPSTDPDSAAPDIVVPDALPLQKSYGFSRSVSDVKSDGPGADLPTMTSPMDDVYLGELVCHMLASTVLNLPLFKD